MGHLLPTALAAWAVAFPFPRPAPPPAPAPQLSKEDEEWRFKKYNEAVAFGRNGKWGVDEAQAPVREILDRCTRKLGKDHFLTALYRREIETLEKLSKMPEADRVEYMKTYVCYDRMNELWAAGKPAEALEPVEQMLAIYRRLVGPEATYVAMAEVWHGRLLEECQRYEQAERPFRESLRIRLKVLGEDNPETVQSYVYLARLLDHRAKFAEAGPLHQTALDISRRLLGDGHWQTAVIRNNFAGHWELQARYRDAEPLYRQALEALIASGGEDGPGVPMAHNNLAVNLNSQGKFAAAENESQRALATQRTAVRKDLRTWLVAFVAGAALAAQQNAAREHDQDVALFSANLAVNLDSQARHTEAEDFHRTALDLFARTLGESHARTAGAHSNLAVNLDYQGKYAEAQTHLDRALEIYRSIPGGETTTGAAGVYVNLASCLGGQGQDVAGQAAAEKAVAIYRKILAADHPKLAVALNNLAASLKNQDKYAEAEPHLRAALTALQGGLGEGHPDTAHAHTNLGVDLYYQGRFAEAEPHLRSALDSLLQGVGEGHPRTAWTYKGLIGNACAAGDYARAAALAKAATASFEAARLRLGFAGLDRALRTADISPLPGLAVAAARSRKPDLAWEALERNLARGLLDHLTAQPLDPEERKRELAMLERLNLLDRQIDELRGRRPQTAADRQRVEAAEAERDAAQVDLAKFQAGLTALHGVTAGEVYPLARIQTQIPDGAALVAWVDLPHVSNWHDPKGDHWACLVKRTGEPVWVQLAGTGPRDAWTDEDDRLRHRFRRSLEERRPKEDWRDLKERLARQRFGPLADHLQGVRHLIILPSAEMAGIPVEALSDLTVTYAPSGTMFAWLRDRPAAGNKLPARHLLALGDPAFKTGPDGPVPLPGSRQELAGIARLFDESKQLMGPKASEEALAGLAAEAGGLGRFPYLHFATHGVLDKQRPMRSALLLARGSGPGSAGGKNAYDDRLTAERMLRQWKLDAELVTLSACQTGLGRDAGGDGYLGFSQALFVAGARSLVVSLWEVDDTATSLLMTRFYENLMGLPKGLPGGPLEAKSKAEALKEAKEWLSRLRPDEVDQLAAGLPRTGTRGRVVPKAATEKAHPSYEHPYYWSGFILIGDPR